MDLGPDAALDVVIELLPRLWKLAGAPFRSLSDEAAWWAGYLPDHWERAGEPFERELLDAALDAMRTLSATRGEQVLVNQDMHARNVLRAEREPWLLIDPKPLAGEREFGIAALVRGHELGHSRDAVVHRLDRLSAELGLDRERPRGWALAQTTAWGLDEDGAFPGPRRGRSLAARGAVTDPRSATPRSPRPRASHPAVRRRGPWIEAADPSR